MSIEEVGKLFSVSPLVNSPSKTEILCNMTCT